MVNPVADSQRQIPATDGYYHIDDSTNSEWSDRRTERSEDECIEEGSRKRTIRPKTAAMKAVVRWMVADRLESSAD